MNINKLPLKSTTNDNLFYFDNKLEHYKNLLEYLLKNNEDIINLDFAKKEMLLYELKANNEIEGYNYDFSIIDKVINTDGKIDSIGTKELINLYKGYKYILEHNLINKDTLKELYNILSSGTIDEYKEKMGDYYRIAPVYILKKGFLDIEPYEGVKYTEIEKYMDLYFEFLNNNILNNSIIEEYIKSQILHYYFVYIHPFMDVNGRTSRTTSMWYLLNKKAYPLVIFNRGIIFNEKEYENTIIKTRGTNNITSFINYMLRVVYEELEKELQIKKILDTKSLNSHDYHTLLFLLNLKGNLTVLDFAHMYNKKNIKLSVKDIYESMIIPLIDKNIIYLGRETNKCMYNDVKNRELILRKE